MMAEEDARFKVVLSVLPCGFTRCAQLCAKSEKNYQCKFVEMDASVLNQKGPQSVKLKFKVFFLQILHFKLDLRTGETLKLFSTI